MTFNQFYSNVQANILNPAIAVLFSLAFLYFMWGLFKFIKNADSSDERETGRRHIIWGVAGMAIMIGAYAIVQIIQSTVTGL
jgi:uncharacterized membrane protein YidH (DUF202 family)